MVFISVIIPAYNEGGTIGWVIEGVRKALKDQKFEIIIVDDGSTDNTYEVASKYPVEIVRHEINMGYGAALKSGFSKAKGDIIVTLDADGQHNPIEIPSLINPILQGKADLVIGSRYLKKGESGFGFFRTLFEKALIFLVRNALKIKVSDSQSMFRAIRRDALLKLNLKERKWVSIEMLAEAKRNNLKIQEVQINVRKRLYGSSKGGFAYFYEIVLSLIRNLHDELIKGGQ